MTFPWIAIPLLLPAARAARVPPDYGDEIVRKAAAVAGRLNQDGRHAEAAEWGSEFQRHVVRGGAVEYEVGLAWYRLGRIERAERHYRRTLREDPAYAAAWYDLGEIQLARWDLDEAEEAFTQAARLRPDHWAGFFRLAEVAARRGDATGFEVHLRDALASGFSFRVILGDPNWVEYYRNPALAEVIRRLVTVYSDERLLQVFEVPPR
ncbi:MAG: tetratricopeptide repeat protein [Deltaproteobacteria bacterium]|nr:tetratricopeptide repeat protein [Deltaproteobacteria bacterium]